MKLKLSLFFVLFFISSMNTFVHAWYNYPYVCNNSTCYYTSSKEITQKVSDYILTDTSISSINFSSLIDSKFQEYSNLYWDTTIWIPNFLSWNWNWEYLQTKYFTFSDLANEWPFSIRTFFDQVDYDNWTDYILSNFSDVIKKYHSAAWLPVWLRKSNLSDLDDSINGYQNWKFLVKRLCTSSSCTESNYSYVPYNSTYTYSILKGTVNNTTTFPWLFISTNTLSTDLLNAWNSFNFKFWFSDYLDKTKDRIDYEYEISYDYVWSSDWLKTLLAEKIYLKRQWSSYVLVAPNMEAWQQDNVFDLTFPQSVYWKLNINITEWMKPTKAGKMNFYFTVKNLTTWASIEKVLINQYPLVILPSNNLAPFDSQDVHITSKDFTLQKNAEWFNTYETFSVKVNLKDEFWNPHYDYVSWGWYDISLTSWSSDSIELSKWSWIFTKTLEWVKSLNTSPYDIDFSIRMTKNWYHVLKWFDIRAREKSSETAYSSPAKYKTVSWLIPKELYDWNQVANIYIKPETVSDFVISCTNKPITIKSICQSDNFSWCNASQNELVTYKTEADNSLDPKRVTIVDYAHNLRAYQYTMNNIDQTAPTLTLKKWNKVLDWANYSFKADNDFYFDVLEKTTSTCSHEDYVNYKIEINWELFESGSLSESNMNRISPEWEDNSKYAFFSQKVDLSKYLSKSWLNKKLAITLTDKYWNTTKKIITFNIYPTDEGLFDQSNWVGPIWQSENTKTSFYTFKVSSQWDKYANMQDNYLYNIEKLSDKFGNPIYDKTLISLKQDPTALTWLKTIHLNEQQKSGWTALDIYNVSNSFSSEWNYSFNLRSYTPWEYSQYFKAEMYWWNDDYSINYGKKIAFYPYINSNPNNQFKRPVFIESIKSSTQKTSSWAVCSSNTVRTDKLESEKTTYLKYKISLKNEWNLKNIENWILNINANSVKDFTEWHKWEQNTLKDVVKNFSEDIDNSCLWFRWKISADSNYLAASEIKSNNLEISYDIKWWDWYAGKNVTYILDEKNMELWCEIPTLWVKVEWTLQWDWKWSLTGQESNYSDISLSEMRWTIRKNAYQLITKMKSGQVLNWIKYVEWNVTIWWEISWYETLIVKNGNVMINGDLNKNKSKFWIIVLKDSYNVNKDYKVSWNIYVNNNVNQINAIIYSDWALRSASNLSWDVYDDSELTERLVINWSLFTRNTIWWATELIVKWMWWDYLLPWWRKIKDYELASNYDLNFVRKVNYCKWDEKPYSLLIKYDWRVQTNPPKWFTSK